MICKYFQACDKFRFCFSKLFEIFFPNAFDPRSVEFMDAEDWQLFPPVPSYKHRENQFSSITQSCPTLGDPMDCSTPGFPVNHQLPELAQTHIHQVCDAIQPSHPLLSASHPAVNLSQHQGLFQWVSSSHQVAKVLELQLQHQSFQWIFRTDFLYDGLVESLAVQGTFKSLIQHHSSKASILQCSAFFIVQLSHPYMTTGKNPSFG